MNYMPLSASISTLKINRLANNIVAIAVFAFLALTTSLKAQTNSVSPLSIDGIGETQYGLTPSFLGLGSTGIAYSDRYSINLLNPAGLTNMDYTTMEMSGAHRSFRQQVISEGINQTNHNSYFDYFGFGFKLNDYFAAAVSLNPYAAKGFSISVADSSEDFGVYEYRSVGSGGYDAMTFGLAVEPVKWFSAGANVKYIFGEETVANKSIIADNTFLSVSKTVQTGLNDFTFDFGAQFRGKIGQYHINAGAIYGLGGEMNAREIGTQYSFINSGIVETPIDTLYYNLAQGGSMVLPTSYGVGISLSKAVPELPVNAWDIVADYNVVNWNEFSPFAANGEPRLYPNLSMSERISVGAVMVPAYTIPGLDRTTNYFAITRYRIGWSREIGQYHWGDQSYVVQQLSLGMSLPIIYRSLAPGEQKASFLNISIGAGQRWDGVDSHLKEDFLNFNLGITLNDKWFQKFRYR
ncbi:MAG: hypothetical protein RL754_46 [Bacteroidota bacterium]|jgi:hypothetical protein